MTTSTTGTINPTRIDATVTIATKIASPAIR
jgi:hypothetical protein